jgi:hypothetical protein
MIRKHVIYPLIRIAALVLLISCAFWPGSVYADRQVRPPIMLPQPGPPPQVVNDPSFYKWESKEIINALKDKGLEVVSITNGLTMGSPAAKESTIFLIPSAGENVGGLVSSYSTYKGLEEARKYYSEMNRASTAPAWRIFRKYNILLLISGRVPEEKAVHYKKALESM